MRRFLARVGNLFSLIKERGLGGLWERLLQWGWQTKPYVFIFKSLTMPNDESEDVAVQFRIAKDEDVHWICQNMPHQGEKAESLARDHLNGKDITIVGTLKEKPEKMALSLCLTPNDFGLKLLGDFASPGDVAIRRVWVPSDLRSLGIGAEGVKHAESVAYLRGIKRIWAFILEDNTPSRRMFEKMGYEDGGSVHLLMRFGRRYAKTRKVGDKRWQCIKIPSEVSSL